MQNNFDFTSFFKNNFNVIEQILKILINDSRFIFRKQFDAKQKSSFYCALHFLYNNLSKYKIFYTFCKHILYIFFVHYFLQKTLNCFDHSDVILK